VKLAVFTSKYPARVATFFERDMRALIEAGVEIDVFPIHPLDESMWRYAQPILSADVLPRDRVHHLGFLHSLGRLARPSVRRLGRFLPDAAAVSAAALRHGPVSLAKTAYVLPKAWAAADRFADRYDHVLAYWGNYAGTCAYLFHRLQRRRVPFSIWVHAGTDLYFRPAYLRQKLEYADNIITCCDFNRTFILERYPQVADRLAPKIHVSYHGLDLAGFPFRPDDRPLHKVIAVGRLARDKGFAYLLHAVRALASRGVAVTVEIVGDGKERGTLQRLAGTLGIADRVTFRGWLTFDDARTAMGEATVLVHPSDGLGDGLPNVLREAMALGTPVIASRVAGIPEALDDGRCGILVPPRDVGALADAIATLLGDATLRRTLAERARRRTEQQFDMWRNGARLAELLSTTAPSPRAVPAPAAPAAPPPPASMTPLTREERHAQFILELLIGQPAWAALETADWNLLARLGQRHAVLARVADRLAALGVPAPRRFAAAADEERRRARRALEVLRHVQAACERYGIPWMVPKALQRLPDVGDDLDLLVFASNAAIDRLILEGLPTTGGRPTLVDRVAGSRVYTVTGAGGPDIALDIHHGRVGSAGQHAAFARALARNGRPAVIDGTQFSVPSPEDQLVLQGLEKVAGRRSFHLCDVLQTVAIVRGPHLDWDYVLATAREHGGWDGLGCYLHFVDEAHTRLVGRELLPAEPRRALRLDGWGHARLREAGFRFRALRVTSRVHGRQLARSLGVGDWDAALRLSLWPVAVLGTRLGRLGRDGPGVTDAAPQPASRLAGAPVP
jgi:glycosyltransferase involved in cell wall biosynthesis